MIELNVRANQAATCKFRDFELYRSVVKDTASKVKGTRVIILVHGFNVKHGQSTKAYEGIREIWSGNQLETTEIIGYSWPSSLAGGGPAAYHAARQRTQEAGRRLAELISALSERGINVSVLGHSLGTVVMGHASVYLNDNRDLYSCLWDHAAFHAGDARLKMYRADSDFGQAMRQLGIKTYNYYAKTDSVLQLSKLALNGKRIGRHELVRPLGINIDAVKLHGERVNHGTYKGSDNILADTLTRLQ